MRTRNVALFILKTEPAARPALVIDGQDVALPANVDRSQLWLAKDNGRWSAHDARFAAERTREPRKSPGLTGPINDAFMEPFLFVRPTGKPLNETIGTWSTAEFARAQKLWRDLFRGDVPVKDDIAVTPEDLATKHLILWGDASSNRLLAKMLDRLPLTWDAKVLRFRGKSYDAAHHAPVLIFPNPLSTNRRYMVLNSGIDFRDEAYGTNALQTPKLPDFAIVDLREPPGPRWPGRIVDAGFFDEGWR